MAKKAPISLVKSTLSATASGDAELVRNPGMALDLQHLDKIRVNKSAVVRRCAGYGARRSIKKQQQAALAAAK